MINIPGEYWYGIKYFRDSSLQPLTVRGYFTCLDNLRPLFMRSDFKDSTPSFYLNMRTYEVKDGGDNGDSVRLCYFSVNPQMTEKIIEDFAKNNHDKIGIYELPGDVRKINKNDPKSSYLINEPRFRKFLYVYTQIGLDLLAPKVLLSFRLIMARYVPSFYRGTATDFHTFEDFLRQYSSFFCDVLDQHERNQLWKDLNYCPSGERCFPHFLANMVAVYDDGTLL